MMLTLNFNPRRIRTLDDVEEFIFNISRYEEAKSCKAGILLTQRRNSPGLYEIVSEDEAKTELGKTIEKDNIEFAVRFYTRTYFETLKQNLSASQDETEKYIWRR
jgi:hypothetical protein